MRRNKGAVMISVLCWLLIGASAKVHAAVGSSPRPPNVLLVMTDDQGWGDVHSHGNDKIDTPTMDALAESGARFDSYYVCPMCGPTRASLLTGRWNLRTGSAGV